MGNRSFRRRAAGGLGALVARALALALLSAALFPVASAWRARREDRARLERIATRIALGQQRAVILDSEISLRVARLGPLLASWETVGGCGAGSSGGAGTVKWIGRGTTGGLFDDITQANYIHLDNAYNFILSTEVTKDIAEVWSAGVSVPFVYKRYNDYMGLNPAVDISNGGLGDINLLGTRRFGPINATSLTLAVGLPTGTHDAEYKADLLTQEKQLGIGRVTGSLTLDHTLDETWGVIVLGGLASWRGGENELGNYRAPLASLYGYGGYFFGPFVPALGLTLTGFLKADRDRGIEQDVPLLLLAPSASLEWSSDWVAILVGVSLPIGLYGNTGENLGGLKPPSVTGLQPWTAALGVSVSPF